MNTLTIEEIAAGGGIFEGRYAQTLALAIQSLQNQDAIYAGSIHGLVTRLAALERATPAREDRRPQLAWWVGEVERLKDCVTRAERELAEAGRQVDHVMRSISRVERERDEARERADEGIEMAHAGTRNAIAERDAARASAEKYREALGRIANGADVMYSTEVRVIAWRALDGGDS